MREQAAAWLRAHDGWIAPSSARSIEDWLIALGLQCATQMPAEEAKLRAAAYVSTLGSRPGYWFTARTLRAAAERFKWFPSVAELVELLAAQTEDRTAQVDGARAIVNGPTQEASAKHEPEPVGVRLRAIVDSYARHYGADDPRTVRAQRELVEHETEVRVS